MSSASRLASLCLLAATALGSAACGPARSELVVTWTFAGQSCAQVGVTAVRVSIVGEALSPDTFSCDAGGGNFTAGADLGSYLWGNYDVTLDGYDASGNLAYSAEQVLNVGSGSNRYAVDLAQQAQTSLTVKWTFDGMTCAQAGDPVLHVALDGAPLTQPLSNGTETQDLPCAQQAANGAVLDGISIYPVAAGAHSLAFTALINGQVAYSLSSYSATALAGQDVLIAPNLVSQTTLIVKWTFNGGLSCAQVGDPILHVALDGSPLTQLLDNGTDTQDLPCAQRDASGAWYPDGISIFPVAGGQHSLSFTALINGQVAYSLAGYSATAVQGQDVTVAPDLAAAH